MSYTWAEPFAGAAACALRLVGGRDLLPPVAWMGGKRRYARAIADAMGVPAGPPARVLLADAGPWGWVWPLLLRAENAARVAAVLRSWAGEHPRALWERLAAVPPAEDEHERAAQWLWLQARSASGVPIWWDGWRHVAPNGRGGFSPPHFNTGQAARDGWTDEERARGCRVARWEQGSGEGRPPQPAGQRGLWRAATRDNSIHQAPRGNDGSRRPDGMVNPATIAARVEAIASAFAGVEVVVRHGDARGLLRLPGFCYLDPPYVGATGYGWDCPRADVLALAQRWADAGAVVAVSEAEPLDLAGWHHVDLTRPGGKPEWLTLSRAPVRVPVRQAELFAGKEGPTP